MNVLLLMSGTSNQFLEAGFRFPKALTDVGGLTMIERVITSIKELLDFGCQLICIVPKTENRRFHLAAVIRHIVPSAQIIEAPGNTAGAACSALLAVEYIENNDPLIISNGDQIIEQDLCAAISQFRNEELSAGIVVFDDVHPRWSFVRCDERGLVVEAAEKRPISRLATAGFYYFDSGSDFTRAAKNMILKDAHVEEAFYVCPAFNELVLEGKRIGVFPIDKQSYWPLADPNDVARYTSHILKKNESR